MGSEGIWAVLLFLVYLWSPSFRIPLAFSTLVFPHRLVASGVDPVGSSVFWVSVLFVLGRACKTFRGFKGEHPPCGTSAGETLSLPTGSLFTEKLQDCAVIHTILSWLQTHSALRLGTIKEKKDKRKCHLATDRGRNLKLSEMKQHSQELGSQGAGFPPRSVSICSASFVLGRVEL